jgi:outer membrane receptor protein involved in Fe transport
MFDFTVEDQLLGDSLLANTPRHRGSIAATVQSPDGWDVRLSGRFSSGYQWAAGVYAGPVPSEQVFDVSGGYQVDEHWSLHMMATNVFDQRRYRLYGGSMIGRRVLVGATWDP